MPIRSCNLLTNPASRGTKRSTLLLLKPPASTITIGDRTAEIAKLLAVSTKSIERWTKDLRAQEKEVQKAETWDMWLDGASEQQIADAIQVHQTTIGEWVKEKRQQSEFLNPPESRQHFDVWQFATADDDAGTPSYFGKLPPQIMPLAT